VAAAVARSTAGRMGGAWAAHGRRMGGARGAWAAARGRMGGGAGRGGAWTGRGGMAGGPHACTQVANSEFGDLETSECRIDDVSGSESGSRVQPFEVSVV
jgi:hypothetical protein